MQQKIPLVSVQWQITMRCNLKCIHCAAYTLSGEPVVGGGKELDTEEAKGLIESIKKLGAFFIEFTGGEPLLREDFFEIADFAYKNKIAFSLFTNGTLVSNEIIRELRKLRVLNVAVSLDGFSKTHSIMRGETGNFEKVVETIKLLVKSGIRTTVTSLINSYTIYDFPKFIDLVASLGVAELVPLTITSVGRARDKQLIPSNEDLFQLAKILDHKAEQYSGRILIRNTLRPEHLHLKKGNCKEGHYRCIINADGGVTPCYALNFPEFRVGNVKEEFLEDIWENSERLWEIRKFNNVNHLKECKSCEFKEKCGGGCRGRAYMAYGDALAPDPVCCEWYKNGRILIDYGFL